ncbi:F-box/WD repeat-containing protein 9-like [Girardinichthys multiradiatus]|uniref:F-box/WD repeat-containing protein 9-like n=1 Tax=Girardinichthys multiradiatus TaxID=208333 RepID=UPI001FAB8E87|nr:F-box/WD repeat-containing protein 9-like [Girardinichthys multiradiatus]
MSEVRVNLHEAESGKQVPDAPCPGQVKPPRTESPSMDLQGLLPALSSPSAEVSPSPSAESSDLLSLPWEILIHIASHLPAHCVVNVLPKVCHTLRSVGEDATAWQLRAQRLIGSKARFPVGPREDFNWPTACLEMEQLITCWAGEVQHVAKQSEENEKEGDQVRLQERGQVPGGHENVGGNEVDRVGVAAQEVAYGADEGIEVVMEAEDGEMQPDLDGDQMARLREELEGSLEVGVAALIEDARMWLNAYVGRGGAHHDQNDPGYPRHVNNRGQAEMIQHKSSRSPSPPPALECITLPSSHIASVNSVLLLGGKGAVCATASRDYNVKLWDLEASPDGMLLHTLGRKGDFTSHRGWVWCLASEGSFLASGGFDSTVRLWDLQAGGTDRGLIKAGASVLCLSCQTDVLLAGTFDKRINMYDTRAAEPLIKSVRLHGNAVMCLAADDTYIISGSTDCTVAVYDRRALKALKKIKLSSFLSSMSYSGHEVWAGDSKGMLHSFSMQTGTLKPLSQFDVGHTALVSGIHRSQGSLYSCSTDKTVKIHIPSGPPRTLCTLRHPAEVHGLNVEAGIFAVAAGDVTVDIWRPRK